MEPSDPMKEGGPQTKGCEGFINVDSALRLKWCGYVDVIPRGWVSTTPASPWAFTFVIEILKISLGTVGLGD